MSEENVIKGPWKKRKTNPNQKEIDEQRVRECADEFTMTVMQQMFETMKENGVDVEETSFIRDAAMIFELVQAAIYRDIAYSHSMHKFMDRFVDLVMLPDNSIETEVDYNSINALVELLEGAQDDPEIS